MVSVGSERMKKKIYSIIVFLSGFSILIACIVGRRSESINRQISPSSSPIEASHGNPINQRCLEEPGIVKGVLFENGKPVANARLYLGSIIKNGVAAFDRVRSITTTTDEQGRFEFRDVPPGKYVLILDEIISSHLLIWPDKKEPILIDMRESRGICLGEINFPYLSRP